MVHVPYLIHKWWVIGLFQRWWRLIFPTKPYAIFCVKKKKIKKERKIKQINKNFYPRLVLAWGLLQSFIYLFYFSCPPSSEACSIDLLINVFLWRSGDWHWAQLTVDKSSKGEGSHSNFAHNVLNWHKSLVCLDTSEV